MDVQDEISKFAISLDDLHHLGLQMARRVASGGDAKDFIELNESLFADAIRGVQRAARALLIATLRFNLDCPALKKVALNESDIIPLATCEGLWQPLTLEIKALRDASISPPAVTSNENDRISFLSSAAAFGMLRISEEKNSRQRSKTMAGIRMAAGSALLSEKRGNEWFYDPKSWKAVVKLIKRAGGVQNYVDPSPQTIEAEKAAIREEHGD